MFRTNASRLILAAAAVVGTAGLGATAYTFAHDAAAVSMDAKTMDVTVVAYNVGPDGEAEGLIVTTDGKPAQVNFPKHAGAAIAKAAPVNAALKLAAEPRRTAGAHPVFELVSITTADGKTVSVADMVEPPAHVEGVVKSLNYARDGRVNGATLDDGTFVHTGPDAAESAKLAAGSKVTVDGPKRMSKSGATVIDADQLNGTKIDKPRPPKDGPGGPGKDGPGKPGPKRPAPPAPADAPKAE